MIRFDQLVLKLALALLPPSRRAWGEAMRAEYAHLREGQSDFAWGCLTASLKENVMTGEGLARVGFASIASFMAVLLALWTQQIFKVVRDSSGLDYPHFIQTIGLESFVLFPLVFAVAALKAISAPTNRHHLADIGFKTTKACLWLAAGIWIFLYAGTALLFLTMDPDHHQKIQTTLAYGAYGGFPFLIVAWFARNGAWSMRNAGFGATVGLLGFAVLMTIQNAAHLEVIQKGLLPMTLMLAFLMFLTATAGALFMWMQRPAQFRAI